MSALRKKTVEPAAAAAAAAVVPQVPSLRPKDELLDVTYYANQLVSVLIGVAWGVAPLTGYVGVLSYLALSYAAVTAYCRVVLQIDEADYGGSWELHKEGFMAGFATFLLAWITTYTALHV